jgi:NAD(P) transhydrogenase subunit alpha
MSAEYQAKQAALVAEPHRQAGHRHHHRADPRPPAPKLITAEMVASMKPGSVVVDLAVERAATARAPAGEIVVTANGVKIVGWANVPSRIAADASASTPATCSPSSRPDRQGGEGASSDRTGTTNSSRRRC